MRRPVIAAAVLAATWWAASVAAAQEAEQPSIAELIEAAKYREGPWEERSADLLRRVGTARTKGAVRELAELLVLEDADGRALVAALLASAGESSKPALPALLAVVDEDVGSALRRPNLSRLGPAARAIGAEAIDALRPRARNGNGTALVVLAEVGDEPAVDVPILARGLKSKDPWTRDMAADALAIYGPRATPAIASITKALRRERGQTRLVEALIAIGEPSKVAPVVLAGLASDDWSAVQHTEEQLDAIDARGRNVAAVLAAGLTDEHLQVRRNSARLLAIRENLDAPTLEALGKAFDDDDLTVAALAAKACAKATPSFRSELIEAATSGRESRRGAAAFGLAFFEDEDAVRVLASLNDDRAPAVRRIALGSAKRVGPKCAPAVPALAKILESGNDDERFRAAEALAAMGPAAAPALPELVAAFERADRKPAAVCKALGAIGAPAAPYLVQALGGERSNWALDALAHAASAAASALPQLVVLLGSESLNTAMGAADVLAHVGAAGEPAIPALVELAKSPNRHVRTRAAAALGGIGTRTALQALVGIADAGDNELSAFTTGVIARMDGLESERARVLVAALESDETWTRAWAAFGLARAGASAEKRLLETIAKRAALGPRAALGYAYLPGLNAAEDEPELVEQSRTTLSKLDAKDATAALGDAVGSDSGRRTRAAAAVTLGRMGAAGASAVPRLIEAARDPDSGGPAIDALGQIGPEAGSSVPALAELTRAHDPSRAIVALGRIGPGAAAATPALLDTMAPEFDPLGVFPLAEAALHRIGVAATPHLVEGTRHKILRARVYCVRALGRGSDASGPVLAALRSAQQDKRKTVRDSAKRALARLTR